MDAHEQIAQASFRGYQILRQAEIFYGKVIKCSGLISIQYKGDLVYMNVTHPCGELLTIPEYYIFIGRKSRIILVRIH